jgi:hypothetical protein
MPSATTQRPPFPPTSAITLNQPALPALQRTDSSTIVFGEHLRRPQIADPLPYVAPTPAARPTQQPSTGHHIANARPVGKLTLTSRGNPSTALLPNNPQPRPTASTGPIFRSTNPSPSAAVTAATIAPTVAPAPASVNPHTSAHNRAVVTPTTCGKAPNMPSAAIPTQHVSRSGGHQARASEPRVGAEELSLQARATCKSVSATATSHSRTSHTTINSSMVPAKASTRGAASQKQVRQPSTSFVYNLWNLVANSHAKLVVLTPVRLTRQPLASTSPLTLALAMLLLLAHLVLAAIRYRHRRLGLTIGLMRRWVNVKVRRTLYWSVLLPLRVQWLIPFSLQAQSRTRPKPTLGRFSPTVRDHVRLMVDRAKAVLVANGTYDFGDDNEPGIQYEVPQAIIADCWARACRKKRSHVMFQADYAKCVGAITL